MTVKRKPVTFTAFTSAIDNYFSEKPTDGKKWAMFDKNNTQHMQILSLARQAQWTIPHDRYGEVADLNAIATWLQSERSPVRKPLMEMSVSELSKIITALGGIVKSTFK